MKFTNNRKYYSQDFDIRHRKLCTDYKELPTVTAFRGEAGIWASSRPGGMISGLDQKGLACEGKYWPR